MSSGWDRREILNKNFRQKTRKLEITWEHKHIWRKITMGQEMGCDGGKLNHWLRQRTVASRFEHNNETPNVTRFIFYLGHFWFLNRNLAS